MKLTQQDMARIIEIDPKTLRNWRKNKPKLYDIVMKGIKLLMKLKRVMKTLGIF